MFHVWIHVLYSNVLNSWIYFNSPLCPFVLACVLSQNPYFAACKRLLVQPELTFCFPCWGHCKFDHSEDIHPYASFSRCHHEALSARAMVSCHAIVERNDPNSGLASPISSFAAKLLQLQLTNQSTIFWKISATIWQQLTNQSTINPSRSQTLKD